MDDKSLQLRVATKEAKDRIKSQKRKAIIVTIFITVLLIVVAICQFFPFWLKFVDSVQPYAEGWVPEANKLYVWPVKFAWENYANSWVEGDLLVGVKNTLIVAVGFIVLSAIVILIVGYVLAKKKFKGRKVVTMVLLITMMVPGEILMVTNYQLVSSLNWTSSFAGLILPGIVNITGIFLVKAFMDSIPDACIESAKLDGASELKILFKIVLPLAMPVISTYIVLTFVAQWNDYLWPMLITGDDAMFTVQLKLYNYDNGGGYLGGAYKSAALIMTLLPVLVVYFCCQKKFVGGLNFSGVK